MATTTSLAVKDLSLDLSNFRTVRQKTETNAVNAMISISPDRFWALLESLLDTGYLPTENIIVLKDANSKNIVKEGNRRIACMKIILGYLDRSNFPIPSNLAERINTVAEEWRTANEKVPCTVYETAEEKTVDRIVTLAHGKGEKASRDKWESVATARHNREMGGVSEPGLDLLEKYLKNGKNLTGQQKERWAGDYNLTVLDEALSRITPRIKMAGVKELVKAYPQIKFRNEIEEIMRQIGNKVISFTLLRDSNNDVLLSYGIPALETKPDGGKSSSSATPPKKSKTPAKSKKPPAAHPIADPRTVRDILKRFSPRGSDRQKIATLRDEAIALKIENNPIAFCFLLRSMFEISAKIYCDENAIKTRISKSGKDGKISYKDKTLLELLKDITKHLTGDNKDHARKQLLHSAITELGKPEGLLSVTSMNQLVHNPKFSVRANDISHLFGQVYPLLEFMN